MSDPRGVRVSGGAFSRARPDLLAVDDHAAPIIGDMAMPTASAPAARAPAARTGATGSANPRRAAGVSSGRGRGSAAAGAARGGRGGAKLSTKRFDGRSTADPFTSKGNAARASAFREAYSGTGFPCRIAHTGSMRSHSLTWNVPILHVDVNRMLPLCASGLAETTHPYSFVAAQAFIELVSAHPGSVPALLPSIVPQLRAALAHDDVGVFSNALKCLRYVVAMSALSRFRGCLTWPGDIHVSRAPPSTVPCLLPVVPT